jgi:short-subunit dehydrogenase
VLIDMSSVWGRVSSPLVSPYVASKNGVRVFSECLRSELDGEPDIHVTSIAPEAIDTPIFDHGANYTGRRIRPVPLLASTEPHAVEGAWRSHRRPTLRRALLAAAAGGLAGLLGAKASTGGAPGA